MDTADLLRATFAEHESDAPDVTTTRLSIEAALAGTSHRRPVLAATGAVAAVAAVAATSILLRTADNPGHHETRVGQAPTARSSSTQAASTGYSSVTTPSSPTGTPKPPIPTFPFRPGWLPPGATFDHAEVGQGDYYLEDFTFGTVPSQVRGLTLWSDSGPLPTRLRDGGVLRPTSIAGNPAVEGWSPSSRSYLVAVQRPHNEVMTVLAYGWNEATAAVYAAHTARDIHYGQYPEPTETP